MFGEIVLTKIIIKNNIPHTQSKVGVLVSIIFSHTPDEAMSVGLVKGCVPRKNLFCYREIELPYLCVLFSWPVVIIFFYVVL